MDKLSDGTLARTQAVSGLVFAVFLVLHLATSVSALFGERAYDGTIAVMRSYYRLAVVEIVGVLGAALVHATCGVLRALRRRRDRRGKPMLVPWRIRLHRYAGYTMLLVFVGHVIATRAPSLLYGMSPNFAFLNFSMVTVPAFFYPYYAIFVAAGGYHLVHGVIAALRSLGVQFPGAPLAPRSRPFWIFASIWAVLAVAVVLALGGVLVHADAAHLEPWRAFVVRVLHVEV